MALQVARGMPDVATADDIVDLCPAADRDLSPTQVRLLLRRR